MCSDVSASCGCCAANICGSVGGNVARCAAPITRSSSDADAATFRLANADATSLPTDPGAARTVSDSSVTAPATTSPARSDTGPPATTLPRFQPARLAIGGEDTGAAVNALLNDEDPSAVVDHVAPARRG